MSDRTVNERRVLVIAPIGADASNISGVLRRAGMEPAACPHLPAAARAIAEGCSVVLLTEEALAGAGAGDIGEALVRQPAWSDIPVVMLVSGRQSPSAHERARRRVGAQTNLVVLERPLHADTLLSAVRSGLRARERQYEVRDLLAERDELLASLEQRVAERTARLQELNAESQAFSYSVSHDLRAPLRTMEAYARALCDDHSAQLTAEGKYFAERIVKNAERMDRLMQDVLAFSRLTHAAMELQPLDVDAVLSDVLEQYPDLGAAGRQITIAPPLGIVCGHAPSLVQCFSNLLQNALEACTDKSKRVISVSEEVKEESILIKVTDNGEGIPLDMQSKIFTPNFTTKSSGTGLGLAMSKTIVEQAKGKIWFETVEGEGTTFFVELPVLRATLG